MKDEIKEILDNIRNKYNDYYVQDIVSGNDLKILLDYITNLQDTLKDREEYCYALETQLTDLQEEVKSANESITWWNNRFNALHEENKRLNNIIDELEKYLEKIIADGGTTGSMTYWYKQVYNYLQELKEDKLKGGNNE